MALWNWSSVKEAIDIAEKRATAAVLALSLGQIIFLSLIVYKLVLLVFSSKDELIHQKDLCNGKEIYWQGRVIGLQDSSRRKDQIIESLAVALKQAQNAKK